MDSLFERDCHKTRMSACSGGVLEFLESSEINWGLRENRCA